MDCLRILWTALDLERLGSLTEPHGMPIKECSLDLLSHPTYPIFEWQTEASAMSQETCVLLLVTELGLESGAVLIFSGLGREQSCLAHSMSWFCC